MTGPEPRDPGGSTREPAGPAPSARPEGAEGVLTTRTRISEGITAQVRAQIMDGELGQGDRLPSERVLAERYSVSRMVVREGMRNLEAAGLIEMKKGRNGGAYVTGTSTHVVSRSLRDMVDIGQATMNQLIEARAWLMDSVVRLACERRSAADLGALRAQLGLIKRRPTRENIRRRGEEALHFNVLLARATGNPVLVAMAEAMTSAMADLVAQAGPGPYAPIVRHFSALIDHIETGDADAASSTHWEYLDGIRKHLAKALSDAAVPARSPQQPSLG